MKKAFAILLLLITTATLSAQTEQPKKKWIRLGVDRDTLAYIIASPFDNWWVNFSVGFQTFIGNEQDADARWNYKYHGKLKLDNGARIEIGKWIIQNKDWLFLWVELVGKDRLEQKKCETCHYTKYDRQKECDGSTPKELLSVYWALLYLFADKTGIGKLVVVFICV